MSSSALDSLAATTAALDPRLRLANDLPDCFLCGKPVRREVCVTVEGDAFHGLKAHCECASAVLARDPARPTDLYARARKAMVALYAGRAERPVEGRDVVRGRFL